MRPAILSSSRFGKFATTSCMVLSVGCRTPPKFSLLIWGWRILSVVSYWQLVRTIMKFSSEKSVYSSTCYMSIPTVNSVRERICAIALSSFFLSPHLSELFAEHIFWAVWETVSCARQKQPEPSQGCTPWTREAQYSIGQLSLMQCLPTLRRCMSGGIDSWSRAGVLRCISCEGKCGR